ncbi:MAG: hypothetical protein ABIW84_02900 [Ilumatobacteraceae bacterium]
MSYDLGKEALQVFRQIPVDRAASADDVQSENKRHASLRQFRNLLAHGLVEADSRRPLTVHVAGDQFARAFHGTLNSKPYVAPILIGSHLPVLAALHVKPGSTAMDLAQETGVHANTVRKDLANLMARGLLVKKGRGFALAKHAKDFEDLARFFIHHQLERKIPKADLVLRSGGDELVMVVESKQPIEGLAATAARRFQEAGANVMAANFQYRLHALKDAGEVSLKDAFADAKALGTSPRTLTTMHQFLENHG